MTQRNYILLAIIAMCISVTASNILVQYPIQLWGLQDLLTYGTFTYPFTFLINDLTNRRYGAFYARRVVYAGFISALAVSWVLAGPRLAIASGSAFLFAQLLDIFVFSPLRQRSWWQAPLAAAMMGSLLDTILFFCIAFAPIFAGIDAIFGVPDSSISDMTMRLGVTMPVWFSLAMGDFSVKIIMSVLMLLPYGVILAVFAPALYIPLRKKPSASTPL